MTKQLKMIIGMATTAVVLVGVFIVVNAKMTKKEEEANIGGPKTLFSFDSATVNTVTIDNEEGFFRFDWDYENTIWKLTSEEQFDINTYAISSVCNYICNLSTEKTVAFDCQDTAAFGFEHPVTLKVYTTETGEDNPYILYVGDATPTYDAYYAMVEGSPDVYTIDYTSGSVFCLAKDMLKNVYLFDVSGSNVTYVRVDRSDETVMEFERDADYAWQLKKPTGFTVMNSEVDVMIQTLIRAEYTGFVEEHPKDFAKYGLDKPTEKLYVKGTRNNIPLEGEFWFGDSVSAAENETDIYGYSVASDQIFKIHRGDVYFIKEDVGDYIIPYAFSAEIQDIKAIDVDFGDICDVKCTLNVEYKNGKANFRLDDKTSSQENSDLQLLYDNFYRSVTTMKFSTIELGANPEGEAAAKIVYHMTDGSTHTISFIPQAENNFYAMVDDKYNGMTFRLNRFTGDMGVLTVYNALLNGLK